MFKFIVVDFFLLIENYHEFMIFLFYFRDNNEIVLFKKKESNF